MGGGLWDEGYGKGYWRRAVGGGMEGEGYRGRGIGGSVGGVVITLSVRFHRFHSTAGLIIIYSLATIPDLTCNCCIIR